MAPFAFQTCLQLEKVKTSCQQMITGRKTVSQKEIHLVGSGSSKTMMQIDKQCSSLRGCSAATSTLRLQLDTIIDRVAIGA